MKYLLAALLSIVSFSASADAVYGDEIWVNYGTYLMFYQSCWTVVEKSFYHGAYCYGEFTNIPGVPYTFTADDPQKQLIIFPMQYDVPEIIDRNSCAMTKAEHISDQQTNYYFDCGDIIFKDGLDQTKD